jgi:hypothetical protein
MGPDPHQRARFLMEEARIAGITPPDALWLQSHLGECAECALYAEELDGVVRGLKGFAFDIDPAMTGRIQGALAARVRKPWPARSWALAAAVVLLIATVPLYEGLRDARREKDDALLMERVEKRVWREVPVAMEPLLQSQPERSK